MSSARSCRRLLADSYETARSSIGLPVPLVSPSIAMFRMIVAEGRSLIRQCDAIEAQAHALLSSNPDYNRFRQVPASVPSTKLSLPLTSVLF
jgi:hypothetical protein